jgi:5-methylcytosine-specific restriction endonuclease McrA
MRLLARIPLPTGRAIRRKDRARWKFKNWFRWKANSLVQNWRRWARKGSDPPLSIPPIPDVEAWLQRQPPCCNYCGSPLSYKNLSIDHAQPLSRHGTFTLPNLRACCLKCNQTKGAMTEEEFHQLKQLVATWEDGGKALFARLRRGGRFY